MPNTITWVMFTTGHGSGLSVLGQWNRYLLKNSVYQKNFRDRFILVDAMVSTNAKNAHVMINHLQTMATETHCF